MLRVGVKVWFGKDYAFRGTIKERLKDDDPNKAFGPEVKEFVVQDEDNKRDYVVEDNRMELRG